jgi:TM2 domain-containing membrane protein YozV
MYWPEYDVCIGQIEADCLVDEARPQVTTDALSPKSLLVASLLVILLGPLGLHRFYLGKTESALSMLVLAVPSALAAWYPLGWLFFIVLAVWVSADCLMLLSGLMDDGNGRPVRNWRV